MSTTTGSAGRTAFDRSGAPLELVLYKFDGCPYCERVMHVVRELGVPVKYRDTRAEAGAKEELVKVGGKSQVPCLFVNGAPMYESMDIIRFLTTQVELRGL